MTARILFAVLIVLELSCALYHEAWAFGRMGGGQPENPYKWLHQAIGWLGCFTIFVILLKHVFYQGIFRNRMFGSWLGVHILNVGVGSLALNFLKLEYDWSLQTYGLQIGIATFTFCTAYLFERWSFSREMDGKLTPSMHYTLIGVNLIYAVILGIVASCVGPVYDA